MNYPGRAASPRQSDERIRTIVAGSASPPYQFRFMVSMHVRQDE